MNAEQNLLAPETMSKLAHASHDNLENFQDALGHFSELTEAFNSLEGNTWRELTGLFASYRNVAARIFSLSDDELSVVTKVNKQINDSREKPKKGLDAFLSELNAHQKNSVIEALNQIPNPDSPPYQAALAELKQMMNNAQQLKAENRKPQDGDPLSDAAIWGYTQITNPEAQKHFVMCHFMERYLTQILKAQGVEMADHKDFFLNAMTDVVALDGARGVRMKIYDMWRKSKLNGGLGWVSQERADIYTVVINE